MPSASSPSGAMSRFKRVSDSGRLTAAATPPEAGISTASIAGAPCTWRDASEFRGASQYPLRLAARLYRPRHYARSRSGSLAMFDAIRSASSCLRSLAARRLGLLEIVQHGRGQGSLPLEPFKETWKQIIFSCRTMQMYRLSGRRSLIDEWTGSCGRTGRYKHCAYKDWPPHCKLSSVTYLLSLDYSMIHG
jgi:hypothetical protein